MSARHLVLDLADRHDGICTRVAAWEAGVGARAWQRLAASADFVEIFDGVLRPAGRLETPELRVRAAHASVRGSMVSHTAACLVSGFDLRSGDDIHLTLPDRRAVAARSGVVIHRPTDHLDLEPRHRGGLAVTSPARTLLDLGQVTTPDKVAEAMAEFAVRRMIHVSVIERTIERHARPGRSGMGALRAALADWKLGIRPPDSAVEAEVGALLHRAGITTFEFQRPIGRYRPDFTDPTTKVIVEFDGWETHHSRTAFEADRRRDNRLNAMGWVVMRITWRRLRVEPAVIVAEIAETQRVRRTQFRLGA